MAELNISLNRGDLSLSLYGYLLFNQ